MAYVTFSNSVRFAWQNIVHPKVKIKLLYQWTVYQSIIQTKKYFIDAIKKANKN